MIRLATDENFNGDILDGLRARVPNVDIVRIQDTPLGGAADPTMLDWVAQEGRILLTHDVQTVTKYTYNRVRAGLAMPGVFEVNNSAAIGTVIEDLVLLVMCSVEGEYEGQVRYLPLK